MFLVSLWSLSHTAFCRILFSLLCVAHKYFAYSYMVNLLENVDVIGLFRLSCVSLEYVVALGLFCEWEKRGECCLLFVLLEVQFKAYWNFVSP